MGEYFYLINHTRNQRSGNIGKIDASDLKEEILKLGWSLSDNVIAKGDYGTTYTWKGETKIYNRPTSRPHSSAYAAQRNYPYSHQPQVQAKVIPGSKSVEFMAVALSKAPKQMAKKYIELDRPLPFIQSKGTEQEYREFIIKLLETRAGVKRSEAEKWTNQSGMELLTLAMTHSSVDPTNPRNNYEILEFVGDSILSNITAYYLTESFQTIVEMGNKGVQYLSKQKSLVTSKAFFADFSDKFGFAKFIRYRPLKYIFSKETISTDQQTQQIKTVMIDRSMMEDVFEAFFAALVKTIDKHEQMIGIGFSVAYSIMSSIYSEITIPTSLNELVDAKSQLKEIFDKRRALFGDTVSWDTDEKTKELWVRITFAKPVGSNETEIPAPLNIGPYQLSVPKPGSDDSQATKAVLEQQASLDALKILQKQYPGDKFVRYKQGE